MNQQQILDVAYQKLSQQQSISAIDYLGTAQCIYFQDNGNKCAVGHLLPDTPQVREWLIEHNLNLGVDVDGLLSSIDRCSGTAPAELLRWAAKVHEHETIHLLNRLQAVHDGMTIHGEWNQSEFDYSINQVAEDCGLLSPVPVPTKENDK